jgi:hypothetical protein
VGYLDLVDRQGPVVLINSVDAGVLLRLDSKMQVRIGDIEKRQVKRVSGCLQLVETFHFHTGKAMCLCMAHGNPEIGKVAWLAI